MKRCEKCGGQVSGDLDRCPLCQAGLSGDAAPAGFPRTGGRKSGGIARAGRAVARDGQAAGPQACRPPKRSCKSPPAHSRVRSPSRIQPIRRKNSPNSQARTAGSTKQISAMASQSMPVMAALAPVATSFTQPA